MMVLKSFNLVLERYWKSIENCFWKYVGTLSICVLRKAASHYNAALCMFQVSFCSSPWPWSDDYCHSYHEEFKDVWLCFIPRLEFRYIQKSKNVCRIVLIYKCLRDFYYLEWVLIVNKWTKRLNKSYILACFMKCFVNVDRDIQYS